MMTTRRMATYAGTVAVLAIVALSALAIVRIASHPAAMQLAFN